MNNSTAIQPTAVANAFSTPSPTAFQVCVIVLLTLIILCAITGNLLVIYAFCMCKRLQASVTNFFIVSLAFSDLITASLVMPFDLDLQFKNGVWTHGRFACDFFTTMYLLAVPGSVINLCAVTIDRFIVLKMPLRYKAIMPPSKAVFIIASLWLYALIIACLPQLGWKWPGTTSSVTDGQCYFVAAFAYYTFVNVCNFLVPMIFMALFWWQIYRIARKHFIRMQKFENNICLNDNSSSSKATTADSSANKQRKRTRRHLRGSRYIALIVCFFFVCWLPVVLLSLISHWCKKCQDHIPPELSTIFVMFGYMNSAMNPFLYPFHDRQFKKAFRDIFVAWRNKLMAGQILSPRSWVIDWTRSRGMHTQL